jgi:biotin synthase
MSYELIFTLGRKVLDGGQLTFEEALALTRIDEADIPLLLGVANKVRSQFTGSRVDTCEIVNARSGNCTEDCKFCAQSAHYDVKIDTYPLLSEEAILKAAHQAEEHGAYRFCIVTAGCGMGSDPDFDRITRVIGRIGEATGLERCCSLGLLGPGQAEALKAAGITRYHHNLEAGRRFFATICTTHTYDERVATIRQVKAAGLEICSGGIIGMGEVWADRLEMAFALRELDVDSVPINVLNPVKGTALQDQPLLPPLEVLQTFAIFRLILPAKIIRYAGGREKTLGELVPLGFLAGINGMLIGNYLTSAGRGAKADIDTINNLGLTPVGAGL